MVSWLRITDIFIAYASQVNRSNKFSIYLLLLVSLAELHSDKLMQGRRCFVIWGTLVSRDNESHLIFQLLLEDEDADWGNWPTEL